ncbi:putative pentatricopeptide repeat-containing protein [Iris pallida]|uniref:Pentatricopeptide repeat-containing protein n=1 Tax=Iris pallida TaxID=29817 RepID=A0AAX6IHZ7_IRIPA|nr:putative pentatricopeptide repeat-containing protein [Iris pallida]
MPLPLPSKKAETLILKLISTMPCPPLLNPSQLHSPPPTSLLPNCRTIKELKQIHSQIIRTGLANCPAERARLLSFCCTQHSIPGHLNYARLLFDQIPHPEPALWNSMIRAYSEHDSPQMQYPCTLECSLATQNPTTTLPFPAQVLHPARRGQSRGRIPRPRDQVRVIVEPSCPECSHTHVLCQRRDGYRPPIVPERLEGRRRHVECYDLRLQQEKTVR